MILFSFCLCLGLTRFSLGISLGSVLEFIDSVWRAHRIDLVVVFKHLFLGAFSRAPGVPLEFFGGIPKASPGFPWGFPRVSLGLSWGVPGVSLGVPCGYSEVSIGLCWGLLGPPWNASSGPRWCFHWASFTFCSFWIFHGSLSIKPLYANAIRENPMCFCIRRPRFFCDSMIQIGKQAALEMPALAAA